MKKSLQNWLLDSPFFKEYPAVALSENFIKEKVFLEIDSERIEISQTHWLLSLEPMIIGVWFSNSATNLPLNTTGTLYFYAQAKNPVAISEAILFNSLKEEEGILHLFEITKSKISHLSMFKTRLIYNLYYKKPTQNFNQFKNLVAAFTYPRKVRLVSFKEGHYFNIFPMDLVGELPHNLFIFGLRHTNTTLAKIMESKKLVAMEVPFYFKDAIYKFSNHHSSNPPDAETLPFKTLKSESFGFPIPEWAMRYHEIEIEQTLNLGSHMLLLGRSKNDIEVNTLENSLYHIHFIQYLHQKNNNFHYDLI